MILPQMSDSAVRTKNKKPHRQRHGEVAPSLFCYAILYFYSIIHYFFNLRNFLIIKKAVCFPFPHRLQDTLPRYIHESYKYLRFTYTYVAACLSVSALQKNQTALWKPYKNG